MLETSPALFWLVGACILLSGYPMASAFINGLPAPINRLPFVVGLYYWPPHIDGEMREKTVPFCTGTIATLDWVITTYGCIRADTGPMANRFRPPKITSPGSIKIVAGTSFAPINRTTFNRYTVRTCEDWRFPEVEDFMEVFDLTREEAEKRKTNQYEEKDVYGKIFYRYYLDYAVLKTDEPWKFSPFIENAPFAVGFRDVIDLWWSNKANETRYGTGFMEPCYAVGWGGWDETLPQLRLRYTPVKFVPYENCELSYCTECSYCNKTITVNPKTEACYKSVLRGDGCLGDEGAPIWCPWYGYAKTRFGRIVKTGSVLGILSHRTSCYAKSIPSIYHHTWNIYSIMTRIRGGAQWPEDMWIYGDSRE